MYPIEHHVKSAYSSELVPTIHDLQVIRTVVKEFTALEFVQERIRRNVINAPQLFCEDAFWHAMLDCLASSCQRVGPHTRAQALSEERPYPLRLDRVRTAGPSIIRERLAQAGSRFPARSARLADQNLLRLDKGGWTEVQKWHKVLAAQRRRHPRTDDSIAERDAARFVDANFTGFGPKQARNLWQILGLTRFEIPIDRRLRQWINLHLSLDVTAEELLRPAPYEHVLNFLQRACVMADNILPCVFDAVIFSIESPELKRKNAALG